MSPKGYMCRRRNIRGLSVMLFFLLVISLFQAAGEEAWECSVCGTENYDSPYCLICGCKPHLSMEEKAEYVPHFRLKCREAVALAVKVENDESLEAFKENTGLDFTEDQYSDSFSWMAVYKMDDNGKKTKIIGFETA